MTTDHLANRIESILSGCVRNEAIRLALTGQILAAFGQYVSASPLFGGGAKCEVFPPAAESVVEEARRVKYSSDSYQQALNEGDACREEARREAIARFCPVDLEVRPDIQLTEAFHLRKLEATLIEQRDQWLARANGEGNWRHVAHDTQEIRDLAKEMAGLYGPMIAKVRAAAEAHKQLAEGMRS